MNRICIDKDGSKIYYNSKGEIHRLDGPAIEYIEGIKYWYKEGKLHKVDGPAREYLYEIKSWYLLDKWLKEKEFNSWIIRIKIFI